MKKRCILLVTLVLFSAMLFAEPVMVNWVWRLDDPKITTFRYQIDGEEPGNWTVVDSSVTSYSLKSLDSSKVHTLYLQQSYNGKDFSYSGQSVIDPKYYTADPVMVNWVWKLQDPKVTTFRYQVDGELDNKWTVVDSSVTSYSLKSYDSSKAHSLYLQQSYDGVNFSESGRSIIDPNYLSTEPSMLNWVWTADDPKVTTFRYQVDGESPDKWVEVDSSVTSYSFNSPDSFRAHTLYLQQSYDGVTFSESGKSVIDPVMIATELVAIPAVKPSDADLALVADLPPIVAVEKVKAESRFKRTITLGGNMSYMDPSDAAPLTLHRWNFDAELGLRLKNMMTYDHIFGVGMEMGLTYTPYVIPSYGWRQAAKDLFQDPSAFWSGFNHTLKVSAAPMLNFQFDKVEADLGAGAFLIWGPDFNSTKGEQFVYGAYSKFALAYQINPVFSMGMNMKYNFIFSDLNKTAQYVDAGVFMGFSF